MPMPGRVRLPLLLALCLLLGACSSTTFVYNRLDFLVPWYLDDYVGLSSAQEDYLDEILQPFLAWHRYEELPRYAALLAEAESLLAQPLVLEDVRRLTLEAEAASDRLQTRSLDWMLLLGERLSPAQVEEFILSLQDKQSEYEEEYLERDDEEYREDAQDSLDDNLEEYLGRLNREQEAMLAAGVARLQRSDHLWLEEREDWIRRLEALLQREAGWQSAVREALAARWQSSSAAYQRMYEHNVEVIQATVVQVLNSRSERQDAHLRRRLTHLQEDLLALSREGRETPAAIPAAP